MSEDRGKTPTAILDNPSHPPCNEETMETTGTSFLRCKPEHFRRPLTAATDCQTPPDTPGCHHVVPHTQPLRTPNVVHLSVRLRSMLGLSRGRRWFRMTLSLGRHVFGTGELSCSAPSLSSLVESGPEDEASQSAKHGSTWSHDTTDALVHMTVCLFFFFFLCRLPC